MKTRFYFILASSLLLAGITLGPRARADAVTDWNVVLERAIKTNAVSPAIQGRYSAVVHVAIYDAVNGIALKYEPYFVREPAPAGGDQQAAAAQAAAATLKWLFPNLTNNFDAALTASLTQITNSGAQASAIASGLAWGGTVANRIIAWRAQDGLTNATPGYFGGTNIGQWRSIPIGTNADGTLPAILPQLATLVPFAMTNHAQFRPGPPYGMPLAQALASPQYATDLNEVKSIGRIDSATRTAEQTSIARLWQATGPTEENNALRQVVPPSNSLVDNARLFALANIVAADTTIVGFDSKYAHNLWRPHHAIRFADQDGNPATEADPAWNGLIIAPRHQEFISNHAVITGGIMRLLALLLGDDHTFTLSSLDFPGFSWTFHKFSDATVQAKEARIYAGIHYRHSCDVGEAIGLQVASYVVNNFLRPRPANVIADWNATGIQVIKAVNPNPLPASRALAMMHLAQFDAVNAVTRAYAPYAANLSAPGASAEAAAAQAAYQVLTNLYPTQLSVLNGALSNSLAAVADGAAKTEGVALGQSTAGAVVARRANDGSATVVPYTPGTGPGVWQPTPPASAPALLPHWRNVTPFTMNNPAQFRPGAPPALDSSTYTTDFLEMKALGETNSATRTPEQTAVGLFHIEFVPYTLGSAARYAAAARQLSLVESARLFALLYMVLHDAYVSVWDAKFQYNYWRPVTAIRAADADGNPVTEADLNWTPLRATPPHPEYPAAHTINSASGAAVLAAVFGDEFPFTIESPTLPGQPRTFQRFSDFPIESGNARVWAGFHWRNSCDVGAQMGRAIARQALTNSLQAAQPLAITQQPMDTIAVQGATASFTVVATGTPPLMYQWRRYVSTTAFTSIPGATSATLLLNNVQPNNVRYAVVVTDAFGSNVVSAFAQLRVGVPPTFTSQPGEVSAVAGENFTWSVTASGTAPLRFQWSRNGQMLTDQLGIGGTTSSNLFLTNVQASSAGTYQVTVTNTWGAATSRVATLTVVPPTIYTRVTNGPVATTPRQGTGAVWADFNNDGLLDLFTLDFDSGTNHYYRNIGNGNFARIPLDVSMNTGLGGVGVSAADYDNDGYLDLAVATGCCGNSPGQHAFFHNNGDGMFTRVSAGGIGDALGYFVATDWADYDDDGFVDALVSEGGFSNIGTSRTNQLWHNNGNGTFSRVTSGPVATDRGFASGALWFDYDDDGRPDLLTLNLPNNGGWTNYLYHNEGNGNFTRNLTSPIGTERLSGGSEGADWGDYNNDGLLDLYVADSGGQRSRLYHNNGGGSFSNVTSGPMLTPPAGSQPHGATWGDYDNDGYLDLVVVHADRNQIYRNNRDGTFTQLFSAGFFNDTVGGVFFYNNVSWVDYDNDGFLDLHFCLGRNPGDPTPLRPNYLYHNGGNSNGWLEVKCVGTVANRSAIGARIRVKATMDGKTFWQVRELKSSVGWDVASPLVAHFGLGDATNVQTLRIEWPSGTVQELHNVTPRQILTVTEPPRLTATRVSGQPQFTLKGGRFMTYAIDASSNLRDWSLIASLTLTNFSGTAPLTDTNAPATHRFYRARSQ